MELSRVFTVIFLLFVSFSVQAETVVAVDRENQAVLREDGLGVEIRLDSAGNLLSVKSTQVHPVEFPDRRGINKAYIIAEEKAKANIARYMRQVSSSSRTVREIDDSLSRAARASSSEGGSWSKENTRKVMETLEEVTGSSAQAVLRGVRILERSYDEKAEEVKVVVGINRESVSGASQLNKGLGSGGAWSGSSESAAFPAQPSEVRRAKDFKDF